MKYNDISPFAIDGSGKRGAHFGGVLARMGHAVPMVGKGDGQGAGMD